MSPKILVLEQTQWWMPELQRQFQNEDVRIHGCRSLADVARFLQGDSVEILVMDFDAAPQETLQYLNRLQREQVQPMVLVIGSAEATELEWTLRELGAISFLSKPMEGATLASLCRRIFTSL